MKKILSVFVSVLILVVIGSFALKSYNEYPDVRQSVSYFTDEARDAVSIVTSAMSSLISQAALDIMNKADSAEGKTGINNDPAIPRVSKITQSPESGGPESRVSEPVSSEDLNSVWGETGVDGLTVYEYGKTLLNGEEKACYIKIADAVKNIEPSVTIKATMSPSKIKKVYEYYIYDHCEVFYTDSVSMEYTQAGNNYTYKITFSYKYNGDKNKIAAKRAQLGKKALEVLNETSGLSTDLKKEKALHDKLIKSCSYDLKAAKNPDSYPDSFSAYGALVNGKAVCQGYAQAMKLLLSSTGIKSLYITGQANGGSHAWNIAQIGGRWRYLDATFDDPVFTDKNGNYTSYNTVSYTYFNFTENSDHTVGIFDSKDPFSETSENYKTMPHIS